MTNRDFACLSFRLLGLWLVAQAAIGMSTIPYFWEPQFEGVRSLSVLLTMLPVVVSVAIGVPVWMNATWLAVRVFPDESSEPLDFSRLRQEPLFALALSIIGVLFVCESIPVVTNGIALFAQSRMTGSSVLGPDLEQQQLIWSAAAKANALAGVARLGVGLGLLAGPSRLAAAFARLRREFRGTLDEENTTRDGEPRE